MLLENSSVDFSVGRVIWKAQYDLGSQDTGNINFQVGFRYMIINVDAESVTLYYAYFVISFYL